MPDTRPADLTFMRRALRLAQRGYGQTSPNPMVGAVLVKNGIVIGQGWHRRAGGPHAEVEALDDARARGFSPAGATLYVSLEPCSTHGRTPPCTDAIRAGGIRRVVAAATDPNPAHAGRAFRILRRSGLEVSAGLLAAEAARLNEAFNHWIARRTPFVTVKAAMTLDGKIATAAGQSKWITGPQARAEGMRLRLGADAVLVGVNTVLADDPNLTVRSLAATTRAPKARPLRRIILDARARTPLEARVVSDACATLTTVVVSAQAPPRRVAALRRRVSVVEAPARAGRIYLPWLLRRLGAEEVTSLLVEGGGEVNASFLLGGLTHRVVFFYAPKILGGRKAIKGVAGEGFPSVARALKLRELEWSRFGDDLMLTARLAPARPPTSDL